MGSFSLAEGVSGQRKTPSRRVTAARAQGFKDGEEMLLAAMLLAAGEAAGRRGLGGSKEALD